MFIIEDDDQPKSKKHKGKKDKEYREADNFEESF